MAVSDRCRGREAYGGTLIERSSRRQRAQQLTPLKILWRSSVTGAEAEFAPVGALEVLSGDEVAPWRQFRWHRGQPHYSGLHDDWNPVAA